jgi:membrane protein DedA with SNARE-associated domain
MNPIALSFLSIMLGAIGIGISFLVESGAALISGSILFGSGVISVTLVFATGVIASTIRDQNRNTRRTGDTPPPPAQRTPEE